MNEWYYLKSLFEHIYRYRIKYVFGLIYEHLILPIRLFFMTKEQKEEYFRKEAEASRLKINNLINLVASASIGAIFMGAMTNVLDENLEKKEKKK